MEQAIGELTSTGSAAKIEPARRLETPPAERRHSFRVCVPGRASIWHKQQLHGHYIVHDLCIEGCLLRNGPPCKVGEHIELVLHLPDNPALWLSCEVRRCATDGIALRFEGLPPRVEDRLQDLVVESYARAHADSESFSLVIEPRLAVRHALVRELDALGERAVGVAAPLDAVQLLLERGERVQTAFIGSARSASPGFELAEFLARHYPRTRRILIGNAGELEQAWLAETTGEVDGLLETPCTEEALRKLLHRISALPH